MNINHNHQSLKLNDYLSVFMISMMSYQNAYTIILYFAATILLNYRKLYFPKSFFLWIAVIFLFGFMMSLYNIATDYSVSQFDFSVLLRSRYYLIQIIFTFSIAIALYKKSINQILKILFYSAMINLLVGLIQILTSEFGRINMLTPEPSSAAFNYLFTAPLLLEYIKTNQSKKIMVYIYIAVGVFMQSKVLIVVIPLWILYYYYLEYGIKKKYVIRMLVASLLIVLTFPRILPVDKMLHFITIYARDGVYGLNESNMIWTSFTMRFSGAMVALMIFVNAPLGVGFGSFHPLYIEMMSSSSILSYIQGSEISGIFENTLYATPKSSFLELTVSVGIVFLVFIIWVLKDIIRKGIPHNYRISAVNMLFASFISELTPLLVTITIIYLLASKQLYNDGVAKT
jgi:hypothetical protein